MHGRRDHQSSYKNPNGSGGGRGHGQDKGQHGSGSGKDYRQDKNHRQDKDTHGPLNDKSHRQDKNQYRSKNDKDYNFTNKQEVRRSGTYGFSNRKQQKDSESDSEQDQPKMVNGHYMYPDKLKRAKETLEIIKANSYNYKETNSHVKINTSYMLDNSQFISEKYEIKPTGKVNTKLCKIEITHEKTYEAAYRIKKTLGIKETAVLNFASATSPGGGWLNGREAQEESITRQSTLYLSLIKFNKEFYDMHKKMLRVFSLERNLYTSSMIYSPNVTVIRDPVTEELLEKPFLISVITCAAPNLKAIRKDYETYLEKNKKEKEGQVKSVPANKLGYKKSNIKLTLTPVDHSDDANNSDSESTNKTKKKDDKSSTNEKKDDKLTASEKKDDESSANEKKDDESSTNEKKDDKSSTNEKKDDKFTTTKLTQSNKTSAEVKNHDSKNAKKPTSNDNKKDKNESSNNKRNDNEKTKAQKNNTSPKKEKKDDDSSDDDDKKGNDNYSSDDDDGKKGNDNDSDDDGKKGNDNDSDDDGKKGNDNYSSDDDGKKGNDNDSDDKSKQKISPKLKKLIDKNYEVLKERIKRILYLAISQGNKAIVLGAFGCGIFENDPEIVANIFKELIVDGRIGYKLDVVVFGITGSDTSKNYTSFVSAFKQQLAKE